MNSSSLPCRVRSGLTAALALAVAFSVLNVGTVQAGKNRPPAPVPIIPTVPAPAGVQILSISASEVIVTEIPASGFVLTVRYVSGPVPPFDLVFPIGVIPGETVRIVGLVPDSDYVFEMRRVSLGGQLVNSGFTRFAFRTKSLAASQPAAPVIRVGAVTATYVDIVWATPADDNTRPDQFQYTYRVIGDVLGREIPTCSQFCFGTTVLRLPRSAAGQRIVVTAYDSGFLASPPSNELIVP